MTRETLVWERLHRLAGVMQGIDQLKKQIAAGDSARVQLPELERQRVEAEGELARVLGGAR